MITWQDYSAAVPGQIGEVNCLCEPYENTQLGSLHGL